MDALFLALQAFAHCIHGFAEAEDKLLFYLQPHYSHQQCQQHGSDIRGIYVFDYPPKRVLLGAKEFLFQTVTRPVASLQFVRGKFLGMKYVSQMIEHRVFGDVLLPGVNRLQLTGLHRARLAFLSIRIGVVKFQAKLFIKSVHMLCYMLNAVDRILRPLLRPFKEGQSGLYA